MKTKVKHTLKQLTVWGLILLFALSVTSCSSGGSGTDITGVTGGGQQDSLSQNTDTGDHVSDSTTNALSGNETIPTIDEFVCMEYDGLKVTAKEIVEDNVFGRKGIKFHLDNGSDKNYCVGIDQVIVNNCMVGGFFSCDVSAGKKANDTLYFYASDLERAGITKIGQIELYFYVHDDTSYTRLYESECVTIRTTFYDESLNAPNIESENVIYEDNDVKITEMYVNEDSLLGTSIWLCIENHRTDDVHLSIDKLSINGYMVTEWFSETVYAGKYAIGSVTVSDSQLEENDIDKIEEVEVTFKISHSETYETIVTTEPITFNVQS